MMKELPFQKGDKVRIKNEVDPNIYDGMTTLWNEAWIRGIREDRWGLPMVLVEWDKNHWTYNGAPDGWTFAEHFEKVESEMADPKQEIDADAFQAIVNAFASQLGDMVKSQIDKHEPDGQSDVEAEAEDVVAIDQADAVSKVENLLTDGDALEERRAEAIEMVQEKLANAEAFVVIGVERHEDPRAPRGAIAPYTLKFAISKDSEILADCFMATLAAEAHQELALNAIVNHYNSEDGPEEA